MFCQFGLWTVETEKVSMMKKTKKQHVPEWKQKTKQKMESMSVKKVMSGVRRPQQQQDQDRSIDTINKNKHKFNGLRHAHSVHSPCYWHMVRVTECI